MPDTLQTLHQKLNSFQSQLDSLQTVNKYDHLAFKYEQLAAQLQKQNEVITQVHGFYDSAWNKLIWFIAVAGAVLGVIVPLLIQWWQNRNYNHKLEELNSRNDQRINEIIKSSRAEITKLKNNFTDYANEFEAMTNHLHGRTNLIDGEHIYAIGDFMDAIQYWLKSKNPHMGTSSLAGIGHCIEINLEKGEAFLEEVDDELISKGYKALDIELNAIRQHHNAKDYTETFKNVDAVLKMIKKRIREQ
ncbi:hypothetical protein [Cesiribacter sp. SM1]|uniref:hypothetical protein n=1 Tax=Cesiribacter sp. SM1 TaxID=2861196 RepID=UPI001CD6DE7F|nr:hypothetical protein [Cesiribacter sp. SM1]